MSATAIDHAGLALLSDLADPTYRQLFRRLEENQAEFLAREAEFRGSDYRWPRDALHNWSRIWEYPFAFHHLSRLIAGRKSNGPAHLADIGSGVTFFPFALARLGARVTCVDIDPIGGRDLARATAGVDAAPGAVDFRLASGGRLPFEDGELDLAYCISVIEHVPDIEAMAGELARVIRPSGECLLTIDIDLRGDAEIGPAGHRVLMRALYDAFDEVLPFRSLHPADLLTSASSPWPEPRPQGLQRGLHFVKQRLVKPLLGRKPRPELAHYLAVEAHLLRRRRD